MKRTMAIGIGLVVGVVASLALLAIAGRATPGAFPYGPPIGPVMTPDTGAGEMLVVVLGGVYGTQADAIAAEAGMNFGDLQGYYVVPLSQFQGLKEQVGAQGDFALVSVFRTSQGAAEFASFAQSFGDPATILPNRVVSLGGVYAGLGQEANPNGSGPLLGPTRDSLP